MNANRTYGLIVVVALFISFTSLPAWAGSTQHHRWEGVAIGIGAAIVGSAILDYYCHPRHNAYACDYQPPPPRRHGYWTYKQVWVSPTYKRGWNPAHYHRGAWIPGRWVRTVGMPGYWARNRVWISCR